MTLRHAPLDRVHFGEGLLEADSRLEATHDGQPVRVTEQSARIGTFCVDRER